MREILEAMPGIFNLYHRMMELVSLRIGSQWIQLMEISK